MAQIGYYIPESLAGTDISAALTTAFVDDSVGDVHIPVGEYFVSPKFVIPVGKTLIMTGDKGGNYAVNVYFSDKVFTKIKPTFTTVYCFELMDRATLKGRFINCENMTSGGSILIDFSTKVVSRITVKTTMSGVGNCGTTGILLNADRTVGTIPNLSLL